MKILYAPWRNNYVTSQKKKTKGCVFCYIVKNTNEDNELAVLHREKDFFIVMNKYPYTPAHFMIIPNIHTDKLEDLDPNVWMQMSKYAQKGVSLLKDVVNAQGVNIGMNLGEVGGAGIAEHIHMHLVPRWVGDTNFITTIGDTRVYNAQFDSLYTKLKEKSSKYFTNV
ncbi:HIT family protein [hydrothermal vent metagenome]|uniref:HIT family protein n=1 Tax=hydrothermal vent metagenome TaxID=652676 RepID=A0A3B1EA94_9ZZZZ